MDYFSLACFSRMGTCRRDSDMGQENSYVQSSHLHRTTKPLPI